MLLGCGADEPDEAALAARAQTLTPADAALASVYDRSCKTCHAVTGTGAPLTGDTAGWQPRMDQGMDLLVDHVITGFNTGTGSASEIKSLQSGRIFRECRQ